MTSIVEKENNISTINKGNKSQSIKKVSKSPSKSKVEKAKIYEPLRQSIWSNIKVNSTASFLKLLGLPNYNFNTLWLISSLEIPSFSLYQSHFVEPLTEKSNVSLLRFLYTLFFEPHILNLTQAEKDSLFNKSLILQCRLCIFYILSLRFNVSTLPTGSFYRDQCVTLLHKPVIPIKDLFILGKTGDILPEAPEKTLESLQDSPSSPFVDVFCDKILKPLTKDLKACSRNLLFARSLNVYAFLKRTDFNTIPEGQFTDVLLIEYVLRRYVLNDKNLRQLLSYTNDLRFLLDVFFTFGLNSTREEDSNNYYHSFYFL
jgi:hypothetical protein